MPNKRVSLAEVRSLVRGRPCLVVGKSITTRSTAQEIEEHIRTIIVESRRPTSKERPESLSIPEVLDEIAIGEPDRYASVRTGIADYLAKLVPSPACTYLARGRWSAIVSLTSDLCLEDTVRSYFNSQPSGWNLTVVTSPNVIPRRGQTLASYKLNGSFKVSDPNGTLALSRSEQLLRRQMWAQMLRTIRDAARDGAYLFLGTSDEKDNVQSFLSAIFADRPPFPGRLIFLSGDPCASDAVVSSLAAGRSEIIEVDGKDKDVVQAVLESIPVQIPLPIQVPDSHRAFAAQIAAQAHLVSIPPSNQPQFSLSDRRQEVIDSLFRPLSVDWTPFLFDLDMPRIQSEELVKWINELAAEMHREVSCLVLRGEAGVGKSTLAKRAALTLTKAGHLVLWCRRLPVEAPNPYRELAKLLKSALTRGEVKGTPIIFCDDPWALRISLADLFMPFVYEGVKVVFVVVVRNSDYAIHGTALRLPVIPNGDIEVSFELTDSEVAGIPRFLVGIGAAPNETEGARLVSRVNVENAKDVLCSFWYLVPDTHAELTRSLQDEYFRLGGAPEIATVIAGEVAERSSVARRAYEFVAVTSGLDVGLPIEILVRALKVNYEEWLSLCQNGKPLWGLLYPDENPDGQTVVYFTRNEVVTQVLLRQLNGGLGHAGEYRVLTELIGACDSSAPAYREFLIDVLVKRQRTLSERLTPREGRDLFELAIAIFPVPDRTIAHHYGKWVADVVNDPTEGYTTLAKALETPEYQFATQEEPLEHIHTSMAAAVVKRVKRRLQDRESGLALIKRHLREGNSPSFFNLHTVHVQTLALLSLQTGNDLVSLESFVEAARSVERALQLAGSRGRAQKRYLRDIEVMEDLKRRMIEALEPFKALKEESLRTYETTANQIYLEAAARKGFIEASAQDKGSAYNEVYQYLKRCALSISKKSQQLGAGLRSVRVDLVVRWRLQHIGGAVDWNEFLGDLIAIQDSPGNRDDPLVLFYTAVAYYQLSKVNDGLAVFARIRSTYHIQSLLSQARVFLRDSQGHPKQLQGVLTGALGRSYVQVDEIKSDIPVRIFQPPSDYRVGATVRLWLAFSMNGPLAAFRQPTEEDILLP